MPSRALDKYLQQASPAEKAALLEIGQDATRNGVDLDTSKLPDPTPIEERHDVRQTGEDLKNRGAEISDAKGDVKVPPRALDNEKADGSPPPKFDYDQQQDRDSSDKGMTPDEKQDLQQKEQKAERSGQQNQPQDSQQATKQPNAVDRVLAADAQRAQSPGSESKTQTQSAPSQAPER